MTQDKRQPTDSMRKNPLQARAENTLHSIFEATAQLLHRDGIERLTTNRIAERAGFSIGTLYQYFPNKQAILLAMAEYERKKVTLQITQATINTRHLPLDEVIRRIVRLYLQAFNRRLRVRHLILKAMLGSGDLNAFLAETSKTAQWLCRESPLAGRPDIRPLDETSIYVLSRALLGVIRSATFERSPLIHEPAFENELVLLLHNYLKNTKSPT